MTTRDIGKAAWSPRASPAVILPISRERSIAREGDADREHHPVSAYWLPETLTVSFSEIELGCVEFSEKPLARRLRARVAQQLGGSRRRATCTHRADELD